MVETYSSCWVLTLPTLLTTMQQKTKTVNNQLTLVQKRKVMTTKNQMMVQLHSTVKALTQLPMMHRIVLSHLLLHLSSMKMARWSLQVSVQTLTSTRVQKNQKRTYRLWTLTCHSVLSKRQIWMSLKSSIANLSIYLNSKAYCNNILNKEQHWLWRLMNCYTI